MISCDDDHDVSFSTSSLCFVDIFAKTWILERQKRKSGGYQYSHEALLKIYYKTRTKNSPETGSVKWILSEINHCSTLTGNRLGVRAPLVWCPVPTRMLINSPRDFPPPAPNSRFRIWSASATWSPCKSIVLLLFLFLSEYIWFEACSWARCIAFAASFPFADSSFARALLPERKAVVACS